MLIIRRLSALVAVIVLAAASVSATPSSAQVTGAPGGFAPLDRPGPKLTVPAAKLAAALHCEGDFRANKLQPVLLNPATGVSPAENYSWNYELAFNRQHRPWCAVTMPHHTMGDIQTAGEYLVHAIRTMHARADRRIAILGHSQGGMSMRWALRFWPDTRDMVNDVIGMAPSNHGTTALVQCVVGATKCPPGVWQQGSKANFIKALNSRAETFPGVSYTSIYSHTDEVVLPNHNDATASSRLLTGKGRITNVATQNVCRADIYEHLTIGTVDPVAYALVMDALTHRGPAEPARIDRSVCRQVYQPGIDPANVDMYLQLLAAQPGLLAVLTPNINLVGVPEVGSEPPLRCYVYAAGC